MPDQTIECVDCGAPFTFTDAEAQFYAEKGLTTPKRCQSCRIKRRRDKNTNGSRPVAQLHDAVCSKCGQPCQVPFEPKQGKPVYCRPCFQEIQKGASR